MRLQSLARDASRDFLYAARKLGREPTFVTTVVLTIALAIGASTAIFSVVNSVLLQPLPYSHGDRLVLSENPISNADFVDLRDGTHAGLDDLAAIMVFGAIVPREDGSAEMIAKGQVTTNFFHLLGARIILGRGFSEADGTPTGPVPPPFPPPQGSVAVLSYSYFQHRYGADRNVIGRRLPGADGTGPQIVGVLSPDFTIPLPRSMSSQSGVDVWIANDRGYDQSNRGALMLYLFGRLKPSITLEQAQAQIDGVISTWGSDRVPVHLDFWHKTLVRDIRSGLLVLTVAVMLLFLVACSNIGNLLLVRTSLRELELAIRTALGAGISRLIRQMLAEALLFSFMGAVLGLGFAWVGVRVMVRLAPANLTGLGSASIDWHVLLFAASCGIFSSIILGMLPTLSIARYDVMEILRRGGRSGHLGRTGFVRSFVIVAEVALAFVLLIGSGLMFRSFVELLQVKLGYDPHGLLTFLVVGDAKDIEPAQRIAFLSDLEDHLRSIPGIESVGGATSLPLHWVGPQTGVEWASDQIKADPSHHVDLEAVLPGYFETLGIPILQGRNFSDADSRSAQNLAIIDEFLANRVFPNQSALDRRICVYIPNPTWLTVIGVVGHQRLHSLAEPGREQIFVPDGFWGVGISRQWALRTRGDPMKYSGIVRSEISKFAPGRLALTDIATLDRTVDREQSGQRFDLLLIGLFASIAAVLATVGLYGVVSSTVRQRSAEIGLRIAFGAAPSRVVGLVIRQGLILSAVGISIGVVVSFGLTRMMSSMLVSVGPMDPLTYGFITILFVLVTGIACWVPARRGGSVDPMVGLRSE